MQKWEYKTLDTSVPRTTEDLNALGQDGWEAVSFTAYMAYFKRPIEINITDAPLVMARTGPSRRFSDPPLLACERIDLHDSHDWVSYPDDKTQIIVHCLGLREVR